MSHTSGVTVAVTDALLRSAAARAGGGLQTLDGSGSRAVSRAALLAVATANAATLRVLRVCNGVCNFDPHPSLLSLGHVEALLRAVPLLRVLDADLCDASVAEARRALCAEGLLAQPLRAHGLRVLGAAEADTLALAADVASHAWLQELCVVGAQTPAALDALLDAALARRLTSLQRAVASPSPPRPRWPACSAEAPLQTCLCGGTVDHQGCWTHPLLRC